MKKEGIILSRTFFCQNCYNQKRLQAGQKFVTIGSTRHATAINRAQHGGTLGFVPHFIFLNDATRTHAKFTALCACDECGVAIAKEPNERDKYDIEYLNSGTDYVLPLKEWNLLVLLTDLGYKV